MNTELGQDPLYVLGHSDDELQRLIHQSRFLGLLTEQVFLNAGIGSGMRVLDVGCGAGDVSFLAARLVGPSGAVTGIDKSAEAIRIASRRATAAKLRNVTFIAGDIASLSLEHPVDAVVGRLVLLYQPHPVVTLRQATDHVRPGGVVAFQECDFTSGGQSLPHSPLFERCAHWVRETFRRGGVDLQMGLKLRQTFIAAGLPAPQMIIGARVEGGPDSPAYEYAAQTVRSLLPMMERLGVATAEEVQIETFAARLRDEVVSGGGVIVFANLVGAWVQKP
jgi:ubiquinone/menaquinone biosynthesis C-methylase UbiE